MSTLLTSEERRRSYNQWVAQFVNTYWEDWLVRAQLRKVITEIEAIGRVNDGPTVAFGIALYDWMEAAKKEIE